jgi:hypothetical protein
VDTDGKHVKKAIVKKEIGKGKKIYKNNIIY